MDYEIAYKGTRWYKCDLHLHTTASKCFQEQDVTAEQWVNAAIEKGLNCVAITDHNIGISVDVIKKAAEDTDLIVFPSVEITCDPSKVHLLIIFDVHKTSADIRDFLVRADIRAIDFGKQEAATSKSIFDIAELARNDGAIVIPAHIDDYNGLGSISVKNLKKFFAEYDVNAVQVAHKEFLDKTLQTTGNKELKSLLNNYFDQPAPEIDDKTIKEWHTPVKYAIDNHLAILTFSDNPHKPKNSKHGLWGIGVHYTWIKMGETPSLEGLRQAFLLPEYRVRNEFDCLEVPYTKPDLWIKSISITKTKITDEDNPLKIDFSPQLNTIIGGRGSGKSSILRFIRGVFKRTIEISELKDILRDHDEFYREENGRPKKGVLTSESEIEIEFVRNEVLHRIIASNIISTTSQTIQIQRMNEGGTWECVSDEAYIDFFEFEHYSQKQIYEIAQEPNALRERIDKAIEGLDKIKETRVHIRSVFLEKSAGIRTTSELLAGKGKIETRIKDIDTSIIKLQQSGITELLEAKEKFISEEKLITDFKTVIEEKEILLKKLVQSIDIPDIDFAIFDENHQRVLSQCTETVITGFSKLKEDLLKLKENAKELKEKFEISIDTSQWKTDLDKNTIEYNQKKSDLEVEGIEAISSFEKLTNERAKLEQQLKVINDQTVIRDNDKKERKILQNEYLKLSKEITNKRRDFVGRILTGNKVKVNIKQFRNRADFEARFRKLIQRENSAFQSDIDKVMDICFKGNVEQKIEEFRNLFLMIRENKDMRATVSGNFINLVKGFNDAQVDDIELILPEDEIEVQYRPSSNAGFKSLSTASAGQKTTAILTFILSYGKVPLILDQPEDDLDNRLVYELIVDRLKQAKEKRQLIIVTHNANIPVNGDSEYIISMDTESRMVKVCHTGSVEQLPIKKEICDVMEGGERAFKMRSKRYKLI